MDRLKDEKKASVIFIKKCKKELGSLEIDLVHHCAENSIGQFIYTLPKKSHRINTFKGDVKNMPLK